MPFGPDISWPTGYYGLEYRDGDYRHQGAREQPRHGQPPALPQSAGEHPYASYDTSWYGDGGYARPAPDDFGYGDPGYSDSRYDGPASEDAGPGGRKAWDYDQPLRYDDEDPVYPMQDINGYSRPGIDGPGYDLSGIIATSDFPEIGYDQPSYDRLSYDDPRYADGPRGGGGGYGGAPLDQTRLDGFWQGDRPSEFGVGPEDERGAGGAGRVRSGQYSGPSPSPAGSFRAGQLRQTRLDLGFRAQQVRGGMEADSTRSDMPAYRGPVSDETRLDMAGLGAEGRSATGLLAPPDVQPDVLQEPGWAEVTSLDSFAGPDLDNVQELLARATGPTAIPQRQMRRVEVGTGGQRAVGRRRGRSSDRRQWLALGAVVVMAAGAITGVLSKFVFSGPSGPAHTISTPTQLSGFTREPSLEKAMHVDALREQVIKTSSGQASDVLPAVYQKGSSAPGGNAKIFMFVGGHLANSSPAASIASFEQSYKDAKVVPAGSLGGEAACTEAVANNESVSMCVWFDNNTFGTLVSPSMTTTTLASTMLTVRPGLEQVVQ